MKRLLPPVLAISLLFPALISAQAADLDALKSRAQAAIDRPELADTRGWIKFLRFEAEAAVARDGEASVTAAAKVQRLADWLARIETDPNVLSTLRGVQEWAYESPVDGSGQPFKIMIPTDYDPARPPALGVTMHGYTGDHLKHSGGMADRPGDFEVAVLGRARGGWYTALSQADILHVIDYIESHWRLDPSRIRIGGGSMGGGATFKLGSRFPHRFAAGQITCGYLEQEPIANLLTFPIYAIHSEDDPVVPVLNSRGPLRELRRLGGDATLDLTTGLGHASWNYAEGNARSAAWAARQVRPASNTVRRLDFTALDGAAVRAWWAEIVRWGPAPKPAHFALHIGSDNTLFAELTNIDRLRLRLAESPLDRSQPMRFVVGDAIAIEQPSGAPEALDLVRTETGWKLEAPTPSPAVRAHTPGGAVQLYDGSPLLIVHGTGGSKAAQAAMRAAAEAASHSPNPAWVGTVGEVDPADVDGTPHHRNLFGTLRIKSDVEVTTADIERCHLVLIGSAAENAIVARIAAGLPVTLDGESIRCSDGWMIPAAGRMLGLTHVNPEAPDRLIFWAASYDLDGYAADATLPLLAGGILTSAVSDTCFFTAADLIVTGATDRSLVAIRSFDSDWKWTAARETSRLLPDSMNSTEGFSRAIAEAARRATGADFAVGGRIPALGEAPITPGITRVSDLAALYYGHPIDLIEISGSELIDALAGFDALTGEARERWSLQPHPKADQIENAQSYRIALPMLELGPYAQITVSAPRNQRRTPVGLAEALEQHLGAP